jgi:hypothetical protein
MRNTPIGLFLPSFETLLGGVTGAGSCETWYRFSLTPVYNNEAVIWLSGRTGPIGVQGNMCRGTLRGNMASLGLEVHLRQVSLGAVSEEQVHWQS